MDSGQLRGTEVYTSLRRLGECETRIRLSVWGRATAKWNLEEFQEKRS